VRLEEDLVRTQDEELEAERRLVADSAAASDGQPLPALR
jgi:hypothetical protein